VSSYFPPPEADGGWRKRTTTTQIRELGLEAATPNEARVMLGLKGRDRVRI
jgi:hypothetical protein